METGNTLRLAVMGENRISMGSTELKRLNTRAGDSIKLGAIVLAAQKSAYSSNKTHCCYRIEPKIKPPNAPSPNVSIIHPQW